MWRSSEVISGSTILQEQIFFHFMIKVIKMWTWTLLNFAPFYKNFAFHFRILIQYHWTILSNYHVSVGYEKKANILVLYVITFFLYAKSPLPYDLVTARIVTSSGEITGFFSLLYPTSALLAFFVSTKRLHQMPEQRVKCKVFCLHNRHAKEWEWNYPSSQSKQEVRRTS